MYGVVHLVTAIVISVAVAAVLFFLLGYSYRKKVSEKEISSAEEEARRIINEAIKSSEGKKREALLEAKEEILRSAGPTCKSRNAGYSKRKRTWTARLRTSSGRRRPLPRSTPTLTASVRRSTWSSAARRRCSSASLVLP